MIGHTQKYGEEIETNRSSAFSAPLYDCTHHKIGNHYAQYGKNGDAQFMAVGVYQIHLPMGDVAEQGQNGVPQECSQERIEQEPPKVHLCQACRDTD